MAISTVLIKEGYDQAEADLTAIVGLTKARVRMVNYQYKPMDQPAAVFPQRLIELTFSPAGTPPDDVRDFYGQPQSRWTIQFARKVKGSGTLTKHKYNVVVVDCSFEVGDNDTNTYTVLMSMEGDTAGGELAKVINAKT